MLTIQCQLESTALQWQEPKELWRLECCCNDCTAGVRYLHEAKSGPRPPEHQILDTLWLANDFTVVKGLDNIGVTKRSAESRNTLIYCTACGTSLITDHVVYGGKVVITQIQNFPQFQGMSTAPTMSVQARHFVDEVDAVSRDSLPSFSGPHSEIYGSVSQTLIDAILRLYEEGSTGDMNAQQLAETRGTEYMDAQHI